VRHLKTALRVSIQQQQQQQKQQKAKSNEKLRVIF